MLRNHRDKNDPLYLQCFVELLYADATQQDVQEFVYQLSQVHSEFKL